MFRRKRRAVEESSKSKAKELSPKEILINQIEQLTVGQAVIYRLSESYGGDLAIIELNSQYPVQQKERKYILSLEKLVDGKPAGKRSRFMDFNKPERAASWVLDRGGQLFS